jgi:hypothetical protein
VEQSECCDALFSQNTIAVIAHCCEIRNGVLALMAVPTASIHVAPCVDAALPQYW